MCRAGLLLGEITIGDSDTPRGCDFLGVVWGLGAAVRCRFRLTFGVSLKALFRLSKRGGAWIAEVSRIPMPSHFADRVSGAGVTKFRSRKGELGFMGVWPMARCEAVHCDCCRALEADAIAA